MIYHSLNVHISQSNSITAAIFLLRDLMLVIGLASRAPITLLVNVPISLLLRVNIPGPTPQPPSCLTLENWTKSVTALVSLPPILLANLLGTSNGEEHFRFRSNSTWIGAKTLGRTCALRGLIFDKWNLELGGINDGKAGIWEEWLFFVMWWSSLARTSAVKSENFCSHSSMCLRRSAIVVSWSCIFAVCSWIFRSCSRIFIACDFNFKLWRFTYKIKISKNRTIIKFASLPFFRSYSTEHWTSPTVFSDPYFASSSCKLPRRLYIRPRRI